MSQGAPRQYEVFITQTCKKTLKAIKKKRGEEAVRQVQALILDLAINPEQKTQPLTGMLKGFRSLHAGRFRIVIRINDRIVRVYVVGAGWHASGERDDIYQVLSRMLESGEISEGER
jgi:mRNA-degrading endonuclease RelE of RelBE toxin-antitoxin system